MELGRIASWDPRRRWSRPAGRRIGLDVVVLLVVTCALSGPAEPQPAGADARVVADARELVDLVHKSEERYRELGPFRVRFEMSYESPAFGLEEAETGKIHVDPPERMLWQYDSPRGQEAARRAVLDGNTWWHIDPELEQVRRHDRPPDVADPLNDLLAGRLNLLAVFMAGPSHDPPEHENYVVLELIPRTPRDDIDLAVAQIDRRTGDLRRLDVVDPLGSRMIVRLGSPRRESRLPASEFRVDVPEGYTLIRE